MLNLLLISDNPRITAFRNSLQPLLKAKVELISDFDHGLKEIFEKRPSAVFIQDHIAGVSADSVAHHIQMLLGDGAPVFILMHDGNNTLKPVPGVFEHLVDLAMPEQELSETVRAILKAVFGAMWKRVSNVTESPETSLQEQHGVDILPAGPDACDAGPASTLRAAGADQRVSPDALPLTTRTEELADLLIEAALAAEGRKEAATAGSFKGFVVPEKGAGAEQPFGDVLRHGREKPAAGAVSAAGPVTAASEISIAAAPGQPGPVAAGNRPVRHTAETTPIPAFPDESAASAGNRDFSDDILKSFEANYNLSVNPWKKPLIVGGLLAALIIGGWYLLKTGRDVSVQSGAGSGAAVKPPVSPPAETAPAPPAPAGQPAAGPQPAPAAQALPSFIPAGGKDGSFAAANPGWERYVTGMREYRVFRTGGRIKALQVIAAKGEIIPDSFLKTVLQEFGAGGEFNLSAKEKKNGHLLQRGRVGDKLDLLVYRQKISGSIHAFVVSLD